MYFRKFVIDIGWTCIIHLFFEFFSAAFLNSECFFRYFFELATYSVALRIQIIGSMWMLAGSWLALWATFSYLGQFGLEQGRTDWSDPFAFRMASHFIRGSNQSSMVITNGGFRISRIHVSSRKFETFWESGDKGELTQSQAGKLYRLSEHSLNQESF